MTWGWEARRGDNWGGPGTFPQRTHCTAASGHWAFSTSVRHGESGHCTEGGRSESTEDRTMGEGLPLDPAFALSRTGTGSKAGGIVIDSLELKCTARDLQSRAVGSWSGEGCLSCCVQCMPTLTLIRLGIFPLAITTLTQPMPVTLLPFVGDVIAARALCGRIPLAHGHVTRAIRIGRAAAAWPSMHLCHYTGGTGG